MATLSGDWNHNSYLVKPTAAQLGAATVPAPALPIEIDAIKWAKGTLKIDPGSTSKGHLVFVPGVELVVEFSLEAIGGQTIFRAQGVGQTGPLKGVVYELLGWATTDATGAVTEVAGGILGAKETDAASLPGADPRNNGLAGEKPGTVGYFKLSQ